MRTSSRFGAALGLALIPALAALVTGCSLTAPTEPDIAATTAADRRVLAAPVVVTPARLRLETLALEPLPSAPADLIARVRQQFVLPRVDDKAVQQELAWYGAHPDYIDRVFDRARPYLHYISTELAGREMPADLALLPIVESAFDPFAYSRGRASGLWQIIPGTGEWLGLKQNWWYDGRRDVVDSTSAALDYLQILHDQFDGDWLLAVAGYNSGAGNVERAIRRAKAKGLPTDFWGIRAFLPPETAKYVPKLLAIRDLVANPSAFGLELPVIDNAPYFAAVPTDGQIDMALAADISGIDVAALYELNPGVNRWATDPDGPHRLLVPVADAARVETALSTLDENDRVRWTRHEIARGESLITIAAHYDTTPDVLREVNGLSGNLIRAGDYLMIPHASAAAQIYSESVAARTSRIQNRERDGTRVEYRVRPGDSLWTIAQRYKVSTTTLASWNAMAPGDVLSVDRKLVIWTSDPGTSVASTASGPAEVRRVSYVVRRGDSLYAIASRFRVSLNQLLNWNGLSTEGFLQPGQSLVLYVDVTEQSS
jgi:membrane-bound lytic murein transglycosylase D